MIKASNEEHQDAVVLKEGRDILPNHPPLSAIARQARILAREPDALPSSRRMRMNRNVDIVSSSIVDTIHSLERQQEFLGETLERLRPAWENHFKMLRILDSMRNDIQRML